MRRKKRRRSRKGERRRKTMKTEGEKVGSRRGAWLQPFLPLKLTHE